MSGRFHIPRIHRLLAIAVVVAVCVLPVGLRAADYDADQEASVILAQLVDEPSADDTDTSVLAAPAELPSPEEKIEAPDLELSKEEDLLEQEHVIPLCTTGETFDGELWYSEINFVYLYRQKNRTNFMLAVDTASTTFVDDLTTDNFQLRWRPGMSVTLGRSLGSDNNDRDQSLEFTYGGLFNWFHETSITGPGGSATINNLFLSGFLPANTVSGQNEAQLNSFEFNFRRHERLKKDRLIMAPDGTWTRQCTPGFVQSIFGGIRYIKYDETFHLFSSRTVPGSGYEVQQLYDAQNDMFGIQGGFDFIHQDCRWYWGLRMQGAALINLADRRRQDIAVFEGGGTSNFEQTGSDDQLAIALELGLFGVYQFHPKVGMRVAYDAFWLHGIAQAQDAVEDFGFGLENDIDAGENGIFHGLFIGLDMRW